MSMEIRQIDSNTWALFADEGDVGQLTAGTITPALNGFCEFYKFRMTDAFRAKIREIGSVVIPCGGALVVSSASAPQNVSTYGLNLVIGGWERSDSYYNQATMFVSRCDAGTFTTTGATRKFIFLFKRIQWDFKNIPYSPTNG